MTMHTGLFRCVMGSAVIILLGALTSITGLHPRTDIGYGIRRKISSFFLPKSFVRTVQYILTFLIGKISIFFVSVLIPMSVLGLQADTGKRGKVVITGGSMELKDQGNTAIFRGGVKLERDNSILMGDTMIYHEKDGNVEVHGSVKLRLRGEQGETVLASGEHGSYNEFKDAGTMWGNLLIIRTGPDEYGQVNVHAEKLEFDGKTDIWVLTGNVHIIQHQTESWSDRARFVHLEQKLILTGARPLIRRMDEESMGEYQSDVITLLFGEKKMILEGDVVGWIRMAYIQDEAPEGSIPEGSGDDQDPVSSDDKRQAETGDAPPETE